jgi:DNA-binding NarL/FixJ family response regulator
VPRFLVADDHPLFREAICLLLAQLTKDPVCREAASLEEVEALLDAEEPFDMILLDLKMPGSEVLSGLGSLRQRVPQTPIVIVSHFDDDAVIEEGLASGAVGYIPKSLPRDQILEALGTVLAGGVYLPRGVEQRIHLPGSAAGVAGPDAARAVVESLTPRQRAVLNLLARGRANKQIADELEISDWTVKAHISAILRKLNAQSRLQAVIIARRLGIVGAVS